MLPAGQRRGRRGVRRGTTGRRSSPRRAPRGGSRSASLADELDVTAETIRRDLTVLERRGVLRRVHGGAIAVERLGFEPALAARDAVMTAEKERIAKAALAELPDEGAILLDAGTTTSRLADALPTDRELTVVANSPTLATSLATAPTSPCSCSAAGSAADARHGRRLGPGRPARHLRRRRVHGDQRHLARARPDHTRPDRGRGEAGDDRRSPARRAARRPHQGRQRLPRPVRRPRGHRHVHHRHGPRRASSRGTSRARARWSARDVDSCSGARSSP